MALLASKFALHDWDVDAIEIVIDDSTQQLNNYNEDDGHMCIAHLREVTNYCCNCSET